MTDKELRALSRLELLELLLEAIKENDLLKEEIIKLKDENSMAHSIENLSVATGQIETALRYVTGLTATLKNTPGEDMLQNDNAENDKAENDKAESESAENENTENKNEEADNAVHLPDKEIYRRMLCFFAKNDEKLNVFPDDIENDVRTRIKSLIEKRKYN